MHWETLQQELWKHCEAMRQKIEKRVEKQATNFCHQSATLAIKLQVLGPVNWNYEAKRNNFGVMGNRIYTDSGLLREFSHHIYLCKEQKSEEKLLYRKVHCEALDGAVQRFFVAEKCNWM